MSAPNPRIPLSNTSNSPSQRRGPNENSPSRPGYSSSVPATTGQGLARTPSLRQQRPLRKAPTRTSTAFASADAEADDEETKSANAQLIADLKEQVHRAEQASEQYRRQLEGMQQRLDEATAEQTSAEERDYQRQTELDRLRAEIKEHERQHRELKVTYNEDKETFLQERERQARKEAELQAVISRLNETLRTRSTEKINNSRFSTSFSKSGGQEGDAAAENVNTGTRARDSTAPDMLQALQEKDSTIEALKFDLAEAQLRLAEQEHMGDGRLQSLEKAVMEIKMQNARLVEENESFQMLLSEKTLKGDFLHGHHHQEDVGGMSSLAEELESTEEAEKTDSFRKLEAEYKTLDEQNKALNLYIDKIIGRMLRRPGFEHIFQDTEEVPPTPSKRDPTDKALPAVPDQQAAAPAAAAAVSGFLQRARSVVSRPGGGGRPRPMSYAQPPAPSANENPDTAPRIPLHRGQHRRARSDQAETDMAAAAVVQQMNRGSPMRTASGSPLSPGIRPLSPPMSQGRGSYFPRAPSGSGRGGSSANSVTSEHSEEQKSNTDGSSTAAVSGGGPVHQQASIPGAVMKQNQLRPLRLVQSQNAEEEAQKRANRGSWMGWLRGSTLEAQQQQHE
ncbi:hypothetical protein LTR99_008111 [Exophiala xenobiotica]|uniref:M protein, serotype 2.1 n=1 Tax=Vermiconidia calcicola TaxID=1690605 RepID=A0AAV9QGD7_9PEZI|nr:hypothetical protein LTR92_003624 [Exophiala xenobiotica]KAK5543431.1 hypothetical protein LTR25_001044 [Vermiconidia calcicola]KAK5544272.1 hypothetical protein LTR23_004651 [Chaetothyriales sp. CCFEE 6169]KAK5266114.1 hypothetical protein LTR96_008508 [Exophiala xenobiotica]KAK5297709.1 hypothetical protein LTR99_008111 [Exophiala xenobiotica]